MVISMIAFIISLLVIFWGMVGYPLSMRLIKTIYRNRKLIKDYTHQPTVTVLIVAHNEEKVIAEKLANVIQQDYPKEKIQYLVSSDNSTDRTNEIVKEFIKTNNFDFYTGKKIWNKAIYDLLCETVGVDHSNDFFPAYRGRRGE